MKSAVFPLSQARCASSKYDMWSNGAVEVRIPSSKMMDVLNELFPSAGYRFAHTFATLLPQSQLMDTRGATLQFIASKESASLEHVVVQGRQNQTTFCGAGRYYAAERLKLFPLRTCIICV